MQLVRTDTVLRTIERMRDNILNLHFTLYNNPETGPSASTITSYSSSGVIQAQKNQSTNITKPASVEPFGLSVLYIPQEPLVDIILVHGLYGQPYSTWQSDMGVSGPQIFCRNM